MCINEAVNDNMLNSIYICSSSALNEEPISALTSRHSVLEYVFDGIYIEDNVKVEETPEFQDQNLNEQQK